MAEFIAPPALPYSDYTFTGLPSGKTLRVQIYAANDAGQAQPSLTVEIVVP